MLYSGYADCKIAYPLFYFGSPPIRLDKIRKKADEMCIRDRCIYACPMRLMPRALEMAYDNRNAVELERGSVNLCMNCGCCSYVCPAKRNLAQKNQLAKIFLRQTKQK